MKGTFHGTTTTSITNYEAPMQNVDYILSYSPAQTFGFGKFSFGRSYVVEVSYQYYVLLQSYVSLSRKIEANNRRFFEIQSISLVNSHN